MGTLTLSVLVAFASVHVTLVLTCLALSDSQWVVATFDPSGNESEGAIEKAELGLWTVCVNESCRPTGDSDGPGNVTTPVL